MRALSVPNSKMSEVAEAMVVSERLVKGGPPLSFTLGYGIPVPDSNEGTSRSAKSTAFFNRPSVYSG